MPGGISIPSFGVGGADLEMIEWQLDWREMVRRFDHSSDQATHNVPFDMAMEKPHAYIQGLTWKVPFRIEKVQIYQG